ncbi:unnamed protein product [Rotaria sp. Silwood1]|nr:unnamed protein product [Rotaria sp. Silwood1]
MASYHSNTEKAFNQINKKFGKGLLIDVHDHAQGKNYNTVEYVLIGMQLNQNNLSNSSFFSSSKSLYISNQDECIRHRSSFGAMLESHGLPIVYPS